MRSHVIFGAGLIGSFIGGILTSLHKNTQLVCRPSIKQKLNNGLTLTDYLGNTIQIKELDFLTLENITQNGSEDFCDFLWITVKCTGIDQVSKEIKPLVGPNTIILCCQNGLGSDRVLQQYYPTNTILRVMIPFNVTEIKPGHLHRGSEGTLCIETPKQRLELVTSLVTLLNTSIMPTSQTTEMQALLWAKLQLNLGNSINALADIPVKAMLEQRNYRLIIAVLMKELLQVTKALQIKLPKLTALPAQYIPVVLSLPNSLFNLVGNKMLTIDPTVRTSMWWDLSQGKKTEIDYLNGAILEAALQVNIECPANKKIISLIKQMEQTNSNARVNIGSGTLLKEIQNAV
ncbi:2-dehydropantoate 2-reductase [Aquimarina sp. AU474]|uniref:2-dehydropantoate 2-reductase n=1 Tax=Aquimarina sp. AU474 TaxID=2108529 RepID=UPI000D689ECB|nr:2-dehydropantoate 2-reductase [Aquimarina sp. AU474]